jgi:hypothetical protein
MIEILKRIDAQIAECSSELSYLRSQQEEGGGFSPEMNELFKRLSELPPNGDISDWNVINDVCIAFFGKNVDSAYLINKNEEENARDIGHEQLPNIKVRARSLKKGREGIINGKLTAVLHKRRRKKRPN